VVESGDLVLVLEQLDHLIEKVGAMNAALGGILAFDLRIVSGRTQGDGLGN
jgi:uncharacterized membrane protein YuzA (DUF378 family)